MTILFITDEFYPDFGANSLVISALAQEMKRRNVNVYVMPFSYHTDLPAEEEYKGIKVIRIIPNDNRNNFLRQLKKKDVVPCIRWCIKHGAIKLYNPAPLWTKGLIFAEKVLEQFFDEFGIDVVVSIHCSIELSFPLLHLRSHHKLKCKWAFYMLDPFETHLYYCQRYSRNTLRKYQHKIMQQCDRVFATDIILEETKKWEEDIITKKIQALNFPKIECPVFMEANNIIRLSKDKINVVCTGTKNEIERNSKYALAVCRSIMVKCPKACFHFIGNNWTDGYQYEEGNCVFYPPNSWEIVRNMQIQADALLNIGNLCSNQLPSKILEYISTGKPIINFYKNKNCPTLQLLSGYPALNIDETLGQANADAEHLYEFLSLLPKQLPFETVKSRYYIYTPEYVTDEILKNIN